MTWLYLGLPCLLGLALWAAGRAAVFHGAVGKTVGTRRPDGTPPAVARTAFLVGWGFGLLALGCAFAAGFVGGRIL